MAKTALILRAAPQRNPHGRRTGGLEEAGVRFDVVSTAGASALIGLLYLAPARAGQPKRWRPPPWAWGRRRIYQHYPVNYKVFQKPGAVIDLYRKMLQMNPVAQFSQPAAIPKSKSCSPTGCSSATPVSALPDLPPRPRPLFSSSLPRGTPSISPNSTVPFAGISTQRLQHRRTAHADLRQPPGTRHR